MSALLVCTPRQLPQHLRMAAAERAVAINPANHPSASLVGLVLGANPPRERIAVLVGKRWHTDGVKLTVGFLDNPPADLRAHILLHMNAWAKTANVQFTESSTDPQVRIARAGSPPEMAGYWSYLGTDILSIPANEPTMNLEAFTMNTPESEFHRVVRHETGHTLGFPHEHMRQELVKLIDEAKAIAYFGETQGWSPEEVRAQVLTPIEQSSLLGTKVDSHSIMCYQIPGTLTKNGKPIIGGVDIDKKDYAFVASIYPKEVVKPNPDYAAWQVLMAQLQQQLDAARAQATASQLALATAQQEIDNQLAIEPDPFIESPHGTEIPNPAHMAWAHKLALLRTALDSATAAAAQSQQALTAAQAAWNAGNATKPPMASTL